MSISDLIHSALKDLTGEDYYNVDEAVARIMRSKGCTARQARRMLKKAIVTGKVKYRKTPLPKEPSLPRPLGGDAAAEAFASESETAFMPLGYFISRFGFTEDEINGELRSGRLQASTDQNTMFSIEMGAGRIDADYFQVTAKAIKRWLFHKTTPPHLIAKFSDALRKQQH
ncbi:MAG: hypothetical protein C5B60_04145 [Chloroflexi bacterium]|nr:MAG: hypothetical protein C5B60_04145 [Chloroflexota bacterium]